MVVLHSQFRWSDVKRSKDRITVPLGVSALGETFITQIITKSACTRTLKHIPDISKAFGIIYDHQSKTWQDISSYMQLKHKLTRLTRIKTVSSIYCKIILHLMFARRRFRIHQIHSKFFSSIIIFSSNATSECQTLDQGNIYSFIAHFCRAQLNHLMAEYKL